MPLTTNKKDVKKFKVAKTHNFFMPYAIRYGELDILHCVNKDIATKVKKMIVKHVKEKNLAKKK